jgi:hypothetical protein
LTPEYDCLRLPLLQERLPVRIQLNIRAVVVEKIELDLLRLGPLKEVVVHVPVVRTDEFRPRVAMGVDHLYSFWRQERGDRLSDSGERVFQ